MRKLEKTGCGGGGVGGEVRNDGLCEQTKILPAAKGKKIAFFLEILLYATSYNMYLELWVSQKKIHISFQSQLEVFTLQRSG